MSALRRVVRSARTVLFWAHLASGVTAGAIILLMSVTGVLLTYERQMIAAADLRALSPASSNSGERPPLGALVDAAARAVPDASPTSIVVSSDSTRPLQVAFGRTATVFVDPASGAVLGRGDDETRGLFAALRGWHRWLGASGEGRDTARVITGVANVAFLFLVLSGFVLWFPSRLTWSRLRAVLTFRRGLRGKARDFNWHNVLGIWSFVPLVVIVASGVVISFRWAGDLVYRVAGEAPPAPSQRSTATAPAAADSMRMTPPPSFEQLGDWLASAGARVADWRTMSLAIPTDGATPVTITIDQGTGGQPQRRGTLTLDPATGRTLAWQPFDSLSPGRRARSFMRFAHTGEYFGLVGQTLAGLVTLATTVLVWTGLALAWRRLVRRPRKALQQARDAAPAT